MFSSRPQREPLNPSQIREIYFDETSQTKNRYLLIGGIVCPLTLTAAACEGIKIARYPDIVHGEMKWGKVSASKLAVYKRVLDEFFDYSAFGDIHFHCLVIDTHQLRDNHFNQGDREMGFNKEIYQLAMKCADLYSGFFHLYPDYRDTTQHPNDLRQILNNGRRKKNDLREYPFRRCQFRNSKETFLLQMSDLFIGAIAYQLNGHAMSPDASPAKSELSRYVLARAGIVDPHKDTARRGKFTIWHRQLRSVSRP